MKRSGLSSIFAALIALASAVGSAASAEGGGAYLPPPLALPRLLPSAASQDAGRAQEPLDPLDMIDLSVHLSTVGPDGPSPAALSASETLRAFIEREAPRLRGIQDEYERGDAALRLLHESLLARYSFDATGTDGIAEKGDFNCVSSAVVYAALAKAAGLRVIGVEAVDHAFCSVWAGERRIDVETTNVYGFDPGKKREIFSDSFGRTTGFAYVPQENYRLRSDIGEKELVSLILRNRIADLEMKGRYFDAFVLAGELYAFLPTEKSRTILGERVSNSASSLMRSGKHEEALVFLEAVAAFYGAPPRTVAALPKADEAFEAALRNALSVYGSAGRYEEGISFISYARGKWGDDPAFAEFERVRANNVSLALVKSGEYGKAVDFIEAESAAGRIPTDDAGKIKENASIAWILSLRGEGSFTKRLSLAASLSGRGALGQKAYAGLLKSVCGQEANARAAADPELGWLAAAAAFEKGLELLPGDPGLASGRSTSLANYEATVLNRSSALLNARKADEAVAVLEEGLRRVPDSARLKERLAAARKLSKP